MTQNTNKNKVTIKDIITNVTKKDLNYISCGFLFAALNPVSIVSIILGIEESTTKPYNGNSAIFVLGGLAGTAITTLASITEFQKVINNIKTNIATKNARIK